MGTARGVALLEREELLGRLTGLVDAARRGAGSIALVAGEAGAGKTMLVRALGERLDGSAAVWLGHCDPLSTPRPLSPLLDIVSQPGTGLADLFDDGNEPYEVFARLLARLRDPPQPVVLVIEDAHWADDATLDLLRFLGRRIAPAGSVVAITYRDDEVGPEHPLLQVIGDLSSQSATVRLEVAPLSVEAVRTLAATAGTADVDPDRLHSVTGGNAFYVTEVLASGTTVPSSIQDVVRSRLMRLHPDARAVVEAVATAPRELDLRHVEALTGHDADAVDRATASGVIEAAATRLRFRHELARLAVERSTPDARRVALHRAMLDVLAAEQSDDHALLAHHAKHAGDDELVLRHAWEAAREASARGAHRQAIELYGDAAASCSSLSPADQVDLLLAYSFELYLVDRQADSLVQAQRAARVADGTGEDLLRGRAHLWVGRALWSTGDARRGTATVEKVVTLLEGGGPSEALVEALYVGSMQSMLGRHHEPAVDRGERALAMATAVGSEYLVSRALIALGTAELVTGDADRGIGLLLRARDRGVDADDDRIVSAAYGMLGSGGGEVRRYDQAYGWLSESIQHARQHDLDYGAAYDQAWQARIRFEQGRWDESAELAKEPAAVPPAAAKISPITALGALGRVRVRRGDPEAEEPLRRALTIGADAELQHRWPSLCGLAELFWLRQRPAQAVELLAGPYDEALHTDSAWARGEIGFWMWRTGGIDAPTPGAASPFAAMTDGRWQVAADEWQRLGSPYEEALALAEGDPEAMLAALAIFDRLGARPAGQWLRGRLRERGLEAIPRGPRPSTRAHAAGLTKRQAEVLALMCDGLGNADIAARLYISKKTVENHVAAILDKLGARSRAQAIVIAGRSHPPGRSLQSG